ncbi:MAG: hypothetical protein LBS76_03405 [Mycoplasmataceae bacterium]|jgi:alanine dehydrogenase|nr:hypothetical protein [Mycoplasmataceae bacterium]
MKIAILKENKNEYRVSLTPIDAKTLVASKHEVIITKNAGTASGYSDREYLDVGVKVVATNKEAIGNSNVVVKLSQPTNGELNEITPRQLLISLFNLPNNPKVLRGLLKNKITALGIEAFQENGTFTLLIPNEQIKGRFGALLGAYNLAKFHKNSLGKTFSPIAHNKERAHFTILNASYSGLEAARTILALGGDLTVLENDEHLAKQVKDDNHLITLAKLHHSKFEVIKADFTDLSKQVSITDVLINTNSLPGSLTSKRITERMISTMRAGSVFVDLAIDQGFGSDTEKQTTSFAKPSFLADGVIHFALENIPSLFANSITVAISTILTEKLFKVLSGENPMSIVKDHKILLESIMTYDGNLTNKIAADSLHLQYKTISSLLK